MHYNILQYTTIYYNTLQYTPADQSEGVEWKPKLELLDVRVGRQRWHNSAVRQPCAS